MFVSVLIVFVVGTGTHTSGDGDTMGRGIIIYYALDFTENVGNYDCSRTGLVGK